jgi:hypothetical protein
MLICPLSLPSFRQLTPSNSPSVVRFSLFAKSEPAGKSPVDRPTVDQWFSEIKIKRLGTGFDLEPHFARKSKNLQSKELRPPLNLQVFEETCWIFENILTPRRTSSLFYFDLKKKTNPELGVLWFLKIPKIRTAGYTTSAGWLSLFKF